SLQEDFPLVPISRSGPLPLSFVQERLWFFDQLLPGSAGYNVAGAWRIRGSMDFARLELALQKVAARHETLRTSFAYQEGVLCQIISPDTKIPFSVTNVNATDADRERKLQDLLSAEARKPFDLCQSPLIRALVLRSSEREHVLLVVAHHTIFDGWSFS